MKTLTQRINENLNEAKTIELEDEWGNLDEFTKAMPNKLQKLWDEFQDETADGSDYKTLEKWLKTFKPHGLTFEYGLDSMAYDFTLTV